jgi:hypothetical protein
VDAMVLDVTRLPKYPLYDVLDYDRHLNWSVEEDKYVSAHHNTPNFHCVEATDQLHFELH